MLVGYPKTNLCSRALLTGTGRFSISPMSSVSLQRTLSLGAVMFKFDPVLFEQGGDYPY